MGYTKITPEIEQKIIDLIPKLRYEDIVKVIKNQFGIDLTIMAISHVKKKIMKTGSIENLQDPDIEAKQASISKSMELALDLCERVLMKLDEKERHQNGLEPNDIRLLNDTIDRLVRIKKVLTTAVILTKEMSFPAEEMRQKYQLKKQE